MTKFINGPAAEKTLMLRRAPIYLRVVIDQNGTIDCLNEIGDTPRPSETLHAYKVSANHGAVHLNIRGGKGGFFMNVEYTYIPEQPSDEIMRDQKQWERWVDFHALKPK